MEITKNQLSKIVKRIIDTVHPIRIVLFDPAIGSDTDVANKINILVVMPDGINRHHVGNIFNKLFLDLPFLVDILITAPLLIEKRENNTVSIYRKILDEGENLYTACTWIA
ncbi:MAG: hypothetical protein ACYC27_12465 [Armatimonadota bacterium]